MKNLLVSCDRTPYTVFAEAATIARSEILEIADKSRGKVNPTSADLSRAMKVANAFIRDSFLAVCAMSSSERINALDEYFAYQRFDNPEEEGVGHKWKRLIDHVRSLLDVPFMGQGRLDLLKKKHKAENVIFIPTQATHTGKYAQRYNDLWWEQKNGDIVFPPVGNNVQSAVAIPAPGQPGKVLVKRSSDVLGGISIYSVADSIQAGLRVLSCFERETTRTLTPGKITAGQAQTKTIAVPRSGGVLWIMEVKQGQKGKAGNNGQASV